jgi:kumamolisin
LNQNSTITTIDYYTPKQIWNAYKIDQIPNYCKYTLGSNILVGIIEINGYYSDLQNDFDTFCTYFELPSMTLTITNNTGQTTTTTNPIQATEQCLDSQWIHTIAPGAKINIYLYPNSMTGLTDAIQQAISDGCDIISMSFGTSESNYTSSDFAIFESLFQTPNICFCASSGDNTIPQYPSTSPNVLSVGGTSLYGNCDVGWSQTTWSSSSSIGGGCGYSTYFQTPSYQSHLNLSSNYRATCDVSLNANPSPGYPVYCSFNNGWNNGGGTSFSCPIIAGIIAIANQARIVQGKTTLSTSILATSGQLQTILYQNIYTSYDDYRKCFYNVKTGSSVNNFSPSQGYNLPTGLGTPYVNNLVSYLSKAT